MIAPHRLEIAPCARRRTAAGFGATRVAGIVERFFAWIQWQRRLLVRWEYYAENFLSFVQLACMVILLRQL